MRKRFTRNPRKRQGLEEVFRLMSPAFRHAAETASEALTRMGVRHMIVGGLAVGSHGYLRTTDDVDILVGEEAFDHHGAGLVTTKTGIPIAVGDIGIDILSISIGDEFLDEALDQAEPMSVAPAEVLVFMKLKAGRRKDKRDVRELLEAGMDPEPVLEYLQEHAPQLAEVFQDLVDEVDD